jgi:hypothetical protein
LIGVRLQKTDLEELDGWCKRRDLTRQDAIRLFIKLGLAQPSKRT